MLNLLEFGSLSMVNMGDTSMHTMKYMVGQLSQSIGANDIL